jgi:hypothetical protein
LLTGGTFISCVFYLGGLVAAAARLDELAKLLATAGVLVLLATPAIGLVVTSLELRPLQPRSSLLALVVLGVLATATVIALVTR